MRTGVLCRAIATAALCAAVFCASDSHACSIPVFRYALERWEPALYSVTVFHRGPLSGDEKALLDEFENRASDAEYPVNLTVATVDLSQEPPAEMLRLYGKQLSKKLPCVILCYPGEAPRGVVWTGHLSRAAVRALTDSPMRREIVRRIGQGDSAVWVFLESGHLERDKAAAKRLGQLLDKMQETLELPVPIEGLRISFSILRLSREDADERIFVNMLLKSESDLHEHAEQPMAFPIFGRGRLLYAFAGKGINEDTIGDACSFLTGACSCLMKDENPGTDMLMRADWERYLDEFFYEEDVPLTGVLPVRPAQDKVEADAATGEPGGLLRNVSIVLGLAAVFALIGTLVLRRSKGQP